MISSHKAKLIALTTLITITLIIIGAEFLAQTALTLKLTYWGEFIPDDELAWKLRPNSSFSVEWYPGIKQTIKTNKLGLRDTINPEMVNNSDTVVMLQGDSNILGYGIQSDELISKHIADTLNKNNMQIEIVNGGTSGYDLQHYVMQMETLHDQYNPQFNFMIFNLNNDYLSTLLSTSYLVSRPYFDLVEDKLVFRKKKYRVPVQMYGIHFIESLSHYDEEIAPFFARKKRIELSGIWGNSYLAYTLFDKFSDKPLFRRLFGDFKQKEYSDAEYKKALYFLNYSQFQREWDDGPYIHGNKLIIKLFESYKKYANMETVVVLLPSRAEVIDYEDTRKEMLRLSDGKHDIYFNKIYEMLISEFNNKNIKYINLQQQFLNSASRQDLYLKGNEHLSPLGHKLLADEIAKYLNSEITPP